MLRASQFYEARPRLPLIRPRRQDFAYHELTNLRVRAMASPGKASVRFAQRYELHDVLGRGGMAVVYRATDHGSGRTVALKQLVRLEEFLASIAEQLTAP